MKTLTTPVAASAAAAQSGWCEVYDFYLAASIATPWGTTNILRLTTLPGGISFFAPNDSPEPAGTQGAAQNYVEWPLKREVVKGDTKYQDDKLTITASNVTSQWAAMLALVKWYDTPVVIRKVPLFQTGLTANDCVVIFSGLVDSVSLTAQTVQLTCSSSLGTLAYLLPSENMHASCRFRFGDDLCTMIKFLPQNYVAGTCDSGSSTVNIKSSGAFTQDTGASSGYGTDLVDALPNSSITAGAVTAPVPNSSCTINHAFTNQKIYATNTMAVGFSVVFSFATAPTLHGGSSLVAGQVYYVSLATKNYFYISAGPNLPTLQFTGDGASVLYSSIPAIPASALAGVAATINTSTSRVQVTANGLTAGTGVWFTCATAPAPLSNGVAYFVINPTTNDFQVSLTLGGSAISLTTTGTTVTVSSFGQAGAFGVKASNGAGWIFSNASDWGTQVQGYYQIPDAQAGLKNPALTPQINFDFGSAVQPKLWRVSCFPSVQAEQRVRLIEFFSSTNNSTWKFECYYEMPNSSTANNGASILYDVLVPGAQSARYWRICVRSRWAESLYYLLFQQVSAYAGSRNWWMSGQITFDGNVTAALAGVSRQVLTSFSGEIFCAPLPVAPAASDTFVIQRGCARTFNACCARLNTENYGGFNDLELQNIVNFAPQ